MLVCLCFSTSRVGHKSGEVDGVMTEKIHSTHSDGFVFEYQPRMTVTQILSRYYGHAVCAGGITRALSS